MDEIKLIKGRYSQLGDLLEYMICQQYEKITTKVSLIAVEWENTQMDSHKSLKPLYLDTNAPTEYWLQIFL